MTMSTQMQNLKRGSEKVASASAGEGPGPPSASGFTWMHPLWNKKQAIADLTERKASMTALDYLVERLQIEEDEQSRDAYQRKSPEHGSSSEAENIKLLYLMSAETNDTDTDTSTRHKYEDK